MYHGIRLPFYYTAKVRKNIEICKFFGYFFRTFSQKKRPAPRSVKQALECGSSCRVTTRRFRRRSRRCCISACSCCRCRRGCLPGWYTLLHLHHPHRGLHIFFLHFTSSLLSLGIIGASSILLSLNRSLQCLMFNYFFFSNDFYVL